MFQLAHQHPNRRTTFSAGLRLPRSKPDARLLGAAQLLFDGRICAGTRVSSEVLLGYDNSGGSPSSIGPCIWQIAPQAISSDTCSRDMAHVDGVSVTAGEAATSMRLSPHHAEYQEHLYADLSLLPHTTLLHTGAKFTPSGTATPASSFAARPMSPDKIQHPQPYVDLPDEILAQIARFVLDNALHDLDVAQPTLEMKKPSFGDIDGMTRASRRFRSISLPEWFRLFIARDADDWACASGLNGMHTWVRHIVSSARALDWPAPVDVLSRFPCLRSASLSLASDYQFTPMLPSGQTIGNAIYPSAPATLETTSGFGYRQPASAFPPAMTTLSVHAMHGSETPLLRDLGVQCPDLRALRLGKCTMFSSCTKSSSTRHSNMDSMFVGEQRYGQIADGTQCAFWGAFPFDHDVYFGSEGAEAYVVELAAELAPLQQLEEISLAVYLTPHAALAEHRLAHYPLRHLQDTHNVPSVDGNPPLQAAEDTQPNLSQPSILSSPQPTIEQPLPTVASSSASLTPHPVTAPPPWSTSQVAPPPYMDSSLWSYDCHSCRKTYSEPTATTERAASLALATLLPSLNKIGWASFFESRDHSHAPNSRAFQRGTGTHEWRVVRDTYGSVTDVERVF